MADIDPTGNKILLNCDVGEGVGAEEQIIPFIDAANIACGYHAGDAITMQQTAELCIAHQVAMGAHPSFLDKENFGRIEMHLAVHDLYELITQQLIIFSEVLMLYDTDMVHVKPHGALYNLSARDALTANIIAKAVHDFDSRLILVGLSGSHSIQQAKEIGLKTAHEAFADRTYQDDGSLTPRSQPHALIQDADSAVKQVMQIIKEGTVTTVSGKKIPVEADTICIHGDGPHAVEFAKAIQAALKKT